MAAWSTLTTNQQSIIINDLLTLRALVAEVVKGINVANGLNYSWTGQSSAIASGLDADTVIPDNTGLAGAASITNTEMAAMMTSVQGFLTAFDTPTLMATYAAFIGSPNMVV